MTNSELLDHASADLTAAAFGPADLREGYRSTGWTAR
jgi:hypothetical protein